MLINIRSSITIIVIIIIIMMIVNMINTLPGAAWAAARAEATACSASENCSCSKQPEPEERELQVGSCSLSSRILSDYLAGQVPTCDFQGVAPILEQGGGCSSRWIMWMQIPGLCPPSAILPIKHQPPQSPMSATGLRQAATPSAIKNTSYNINSC